MVDEVVRHARAVVGYDHLERQPLASAAGDRDLDAGPIGGAQGDLAAGARRGLGRVLEQIGDRLQQLAAIGRHGRQRWIVAFAKADMPREARPRRAPRLVEHVRGC